MLLSPVGGHCQATVTDENKRVDITTFTTPTGDVILVDGFLHQENHVIQNPDGSITTEDHANYSEIVGTSAITGEKFVAQQTVQTLFFFTPSGAPRLIIFTNNFTLVGQSTGRIIGVHIHETINL